MLLITFGTGHSFGSSSSGVALPEGDCEGEAEEDQEELKLIESIQASISSIREAAADGEGSEVGGLFWTEGSWEKVVSKDRKHYKTMKKSVQYYSTITFFTMLVRSATGVAMEEEDLLMMLAVALLLLFPPILCCRTAICSPIAASSLAISPASIPAKGGGVDSAASASAAVQESSASSNRRRTSDMSSSDGKNIKEKKSI